MQNVQILIIYLFSFSVNYFKIYPLRFCAELRIKLLTLNLDTIEIAMVKKNALKTPLNCNE